MSSTKLVLMAKVKKSEHKIAGDMKTYDGMELMARKLYKEVQNAFNGRRCILKEEMQQASDLQTLYNQQLILEGRNVYEEVNAIRNRVRNLKSYLSTQQIKDVNKVKQLIEETERELSKFRYELKKSTQSLIHDEIALLQECSIFDDKMKAWKQESDPGKSRHSVSNTSIAVTSNLNLPSQVITYQHFLASNGGLTGGWTDFDHNTFLRIRRRILKSRLTAGLPKHPDCTEKDIKVEALLAGDAAESFFNEVAAVLPSKTPEMVKQHEHWWASLQNFEADKKAAVENWKAQKTTEKAGVASSAPASGAATSPKKLADQSSAQTHLRERQRAKVEAWRANKRREAEEKREAELALQRARYEAEEQKRQARMNSLRAKLEDFVKRREQIVARRAEYRAVHERSGRAAHRELCAIISARIQERATTTKNKKKSLLNNDDLDNKTPDTSGSSRLCWQERQDLPIFGENSANSNERMFRTRSAKRESQKAEEVERQQRVEHARSMLMVSPGRDPSRLYRPTKCWRAHVEASPVGVNVSGVVLSALSCRRAIPTWRAGLNP